MGRKSADDYAEVLYLSRCRPCRRRLPLRCLGNLGACLRDPREAPQACARVGTCIRVGWVPLSLRKGGEQRAVCDDSPGDLEWSTWLA